MPLSLAPFFWQIIEVHPEDYKRVFGGADGPGAGFAEVVPKEALFLPQGGADKGAEEVRRCLHVLLCLLLRGGGVGGG